MDNPPPQAAQPGGGTVRIPLIPQAQLTPEQAAVAEEIMATRGAPGVPVVAAFGALLHSPEAARAVAGVGAQLRFRSSVPDDVREALILAVAGLLGAEYERLHHEPIARRAGLDAEQIVALRNGHLTAPALTEEMALAAQLAHEVVRPGVEAERLVAECRARFGDATTVDLVLTASYYGMIAAVQRVFHITVDDDPR
ncbi:MAG TPA: carboxymuconolactone decarboxylase family protein [Candidatus Dormibacteraeota bacterium]|nr:carboxymuconolactone decarboxylase family protein [Candidatus Dormibacteraeota bacterium]